MPVRNHGYFLDHLKIILYLDNPLIKLGLIELWSAVVLSRFVVTVHTSVVDYKQQHCTMIILRMMYACRILKRCHLVMRL